MELPLYQIDAFTDQLFGGNPACVVPLQQWLPDELMLQIAKENAVAETAFFIPSGDHYALRWFTPEIEMDLCGHATLATAHAIHTILGNTSPSLIFESQSGPLQVTIMDDLYRLQFPARPPQPAALPLQISTALSKQPVQVLKARDYVLVYESEEDILQIRINRQIMDQINIDPGGVVITARGTACDFVSRFFTPQASVFEDPVTGSAHCSLIPYWSRQTGKKEMVAMQLSDRRGKLYCTDKDDEVWIAGHARTYANGILYTR
ncbi:MAG TPA: PhzF family phenazine biosynthesis protein [Chitinophaga sp.]|uniref:PhzF family phenazine biosynthesis protein n=1 Tax=Chitinophaga sp. TaxID=1869181 RepID=UPI002B918471|nr:PhzF family phenazine biosynthesis protein [Chitinophaga sp.]HVI48630.1 PhzF family phenazine biosynthesis protein [Chitinophaga sp.]